MIGVVYKIPQWGNMNLAEAIWMLSGFLTLLVTSSHLLTLWGDWVQQMVLEREIHSQVAWDNLRREILRFAQGSVPAGIGVYACLTPPPIPGPAVISTAGLLITIMFLTSSFITCLQSHLDWKGRDKVTRLIQEGKNGHGSSS